MIQRTEIDSFFDFFDPNQLDLIQISRFDSQHTKLYNNIVILIKTDNLNQI